MLSLRLQPTLALVLNALLFQCLWWGIILSHDGHGWIFAALYGAFHFLVISRDTWLELGFVTLVVAIGVAADVLWFAFGLMLNNGTHYLPLWLIPLWFAFATTLPHSLSWLAKFPFVAAIFGAVFGPLSYWAGAQFTGVSMPDLVLCLATMAAFWALALPAFFYVWQLFQARQAREVPLA